MAAKSKDPIDISVWIIKVIDSCVTMSQIGSSLVLVKQYMIMYPFHDGDYLLTHYYNKLNKLIHSYEKI